MNKVELGAVVANKMGLDKKQGVEAVEAVLGAISEQIVAGEKLSLAGFGIFEKVARPARTGRNPSTGAAIEMAATSVPKFRPAAQLKSAVAGG